MLTIAMIPLFLGAKVVTYGIQDGTPKNTAVFVSSMIVPAATFLRFGYALIMIPRKLKRLGVYDGHAAKSYTIPAIILLAVNEGSFMALQIF